MFLIVIAVAGIKLGQGFDTDLKEIFNKGNRMMIAKGVLTAMFLVPCLILLIIYIFQPSQQIALALIILSICPPGDLSIQQVTKLGGNVPLSAGVLTISSALSMVTAPIFLRLFEKIVGIHVNFELSELVHKIALEIFLPMIVGMVLRRLFFKYAWLAKSVTHTALLLLYAILIFLIVMHISDFGHLKLYFYCLFTASIMGSYLLGIIMSSKNHSHQISLGIESALRNPGLAILIASHNFAREDVLLGTIPYIATMAVVVCLCTILLKYVQKLVK